MAELNSSGYVCQYDFFFLPFNERTRRNRGFAFVNFTDAMVAQRFYSQYHGGFLRSFWEDGQEPLRILPADCQGFEANALRVTRAGSESHGRPMLLRAPPQVDGLDQKGSRQAKVELGGQMAFQASAMPFQAPSSSELPPWPLVCAGQAKPPQPYRQMQPTMPSFCGRCGGQLNGGFRFCPYCGCQMC
jgi:hypothetical protein